MYYFSKLEHITHNKAKKKNKEANVVKTNKFALTPSLLQPVKFPGWKMLTYTPANSILDGPIINRLCILVKVLSRAHTKGANKP